MNATDTDQTIRIVVVDDQVLVREGLRRVFARVRDFKLVGECSDGSEVLAEVRRTQPDIVLMDMRMKRMGGAEAIRQLAALDDRPPVLVLTTFDDAETLRSALDAGAEGFLLKESVTVDLARAVRTVANGGAWLDPEVTGAVLAAYREEQATRQVPNRSGLEVLSERELQVLRLMALGHMNSEIADELFISERTVKSHIGHIFAKLGVRDRVGAVLCALDCGLIER